MSEKSVPFSFYLILLTTSKAFLLMISVGFSFSFSSSAYALYNACSLPIYRLSGEPI
jgi:hypothetical protein